MHTHTHTHTHTACRQCSNPPHSGVDCDGEAYGSWACAGAQFSGTAADTKDQTWRGVPGQLLTTQFIQYTVPSSLTWQDELLENVYYVWALCRDQTQYDPITAWKVLEFGIAAAGKMLV